MLTAGATALLFSFKTPSEMFASGPDGLFGADVVAAASGSLPMAIASTSAGSSTGSGLPGLSQASEPPATLAPATEPPPAAAPPTETPASEPPPDRIVEGQVVRTPYGLVQVAVAVGPSGIVDVQALQLPYDRNYSARISKAVEPMLRAEALQAQSADIDLISGATYTSKGYAMSLQSALDQAAASMTAPA
jgi:uncharacterized protein with FMN-binding domain